MSLNSSPLPLLLPRNVCVRARVARQLICTLTSDIRSSYASAAKQPRPKSRGLQIVVSNSGQSLQRTDQRHRSRILTAWDELDQRVIDTAVRQWRGERVFVRVLKPKANTFERKLSQ